ncbi:ABC transporter ATP-binding protein [Paramaledivibacter caminithermalis]|jgi:iron(III) transport system ATP-binding protein|uniref:ABC-type quaternary amine transporter n=1 Tax=Paramaledivibacter caminithermalis (strain DSM 15212 / CIP 107654 / DViRD3) TaxID=1121301 RepID=A0A1M6K385_PARC5|nr:ABC transporter ATP-binding protein [Paramaledivibacter caminithermalis]SHJ53453.1 iron(III) transport system ATP-binding protein [Paramaledivibacter caminithermalis DSM 15212]
MYIEIKGLYFKYKNAKEETLKNFTMSIEKGEIVSILGESGSGKSTVLRVISGLEVPSHGMIKINNKTIIDEKEFIPPEKRGVGMVFQDYALFPHMTVGQNIKFGLKDMNRREKLNRLKEVLDLVNLEGFEKRYPYELSGGQQQRVALARALAPKPSVLLLDEPFSNLDADLQTKIREELKKIIKKAGITSIFVTHDKEDSKAIADKVIILKEGEIIKVGDVNIL